MMMYSMEEEPQLRPAITVREKRI